MKKWIAVTMLACLISGFSGVHSKNVSAANPVHIYTMTDEAIAD